MSAFLPLLVQAYDFESCGDCHEETLAKDKKRLYLHSPFKQEQCGECHAAKASTHPSGEYAVKAFSTGLEDRRKIDWLGDSTMKDIHHGFILPGDKAGHTLVVELHGSDGVYSRHEIGIPSLAYIPKVVDSSKPPAISNMQVLKVEYGVFLRVTIGWQTDTLTDALVRYGKLDLSQTSEPSKRFGLQHQVILNNLQPDRRYRFVVISNDLFGRSQVSESMTFSTSQPLVMRQPDYPDNMLNNGNKAGITSSFQQLGPDYLLELRLEQPAAISIGSKGVIREQPATIESVGAMGGDNEFHAGLSSEFVISRDACLNCHQHHNTASHPVNVYPKPGMIIPAEYPTLPDGQITCRTCHVSHSSERESLTRKRGKRELCVGCHRDML